MIRITSRGIQYLEGDLVQQAASRVTFNVRNAYDSIFGTQQHAEMSVSFEFSTVEAGLDRAEEEIEQRGGRHAAALKELIAEVRALQKTGSRWAGGASRGTWRSYNGRVGYGAISLARCCLSPQARSSVGPPP